jgi:hypothetical protein
VNQERCVEHQSEDKHDEEDDAEDEERDFSPVEHDPPDVQRDRHNDKAHAQRDEESY